MFIIDNVIDEIILTSHCRVNSMKKQKNSTSLIQSSWSFLIRINEIMNGCEGDMQRNWWTLMNEQHERQLFWLVEWM